VLLLVVSAVFVASSYAKTGLVTLKFAKVALIAGAGAGWAILTYDGRSYPSLVATDREPRRFLGQYIGMSARAKHSNSRGLQLGGMQRRKLSKVIP
jgi:hypothetical protein